MRTRLRWSWLRQNRAVRRWRSTSHGRSLGAHRIRSSQQRRQFSEIRGPWTPPQIQNETGEAGTSSPMSFAACVGRQMVSRHTMFLQSSPISKHSIRHGRDAFVEVVMPSQSVFCYHSLETDHRNAPAGPAGAPAVTTVVCSCDARRHLLPRGAVQDPVYGGGLLGAVSCSIEVARCSRASARARRCAAQQTNHAAGN